MVRRLDLPAVLELSAPSGGRHYATLTAIDDATATLAFGEKRFTFALADVDAAWDGGFTVLSKAPRLATVPLRPGARGRDVAWLRQRLAEIEGTGATVKTSEVYDDELRARVIAFQRREKLVADGIVGDETLARLTSVIDTTVPSLSSAGRKS
jgi:general secretion pathway protein A